MNIYEVNSRIEMRNLVLAVVLNLCSVAALTAVYEQAAKPQAMVGDVATLPELPALSGWLKARLEGYVQHHYEEPMLVDDDHNIPDREPAMPTTKNDMAYVQCAPMVYIQNYYQINSIVTNNYFYQPNYIYARENPWSWHCYVPISIEDNLVNVEERNHKLRTVIISGIRDKVLCLLIIAAELGEHAKFVDDKRHKIAVLDFDKLIAFTLEKYPSKSTKPSRVRNKALNQWFERKYYQDGYQFTLKVIPEVVSNYEASLNEIYLFLNSRGIKF